MTTLIKKNKTKFVHLLNACRTKYCKFRIFVRILFSWIAFKDIIAMLKIRNKGMIYVYQYKTTEWFRQFMRVIFSQNFASAKFRENKTLAKMLDSSMKIPLPYPDHVNDPKNNIYTNWKFTQFAMNRKNMSAQNIAIAVLWYCIL